MWLKYASHYFIIYESATWIARESHSLESKRKI